MSSRLCAVCLWTGSGDGTIEREYGDVRNENEKGDGGDEDGEGDVVAVAVAVAVVVVGQRCKFGEKLAGLEVVTISFKSGACAFLRVVALHCPPTKGPGPGPGPLSLAAKAQAGDKDKRGHRTRTLDGALRCVCLYVIINLNPIRDERASATTRGVCMDVDRIGKDNEMCSV